MSGPETNYRAWLAKAESDLLNIENNLSAARIPWDTICFHAQQAAEKLLKAVLVYRGRSPARTHDLIALLAACVEVNPALAGLEEDCRRLSYYSVTSRYPADLYEPGEDDAREMIAAARRVRAQILSGLP
jgi:HEPN domain-containing protein